MERLTIRPEATPDRRSSLQSNTTEPACLSRSVKRRTMKPLFATSLLCSAASLFALVGLSAVTVAPGAETWRMGIMLTVAVVMAAWLGLAGWIWPRLRGPAGAAISRLLGRALVFAGVVYALLVLLCSFG